MKKNAVASSLALFICFGYSVHGAADNRCEADQLTVSATYCRALLTCEAGYVGNPDKDPFYFKTQKCLSKAGENFTKAYDKTITAALKRGESCVIDNAFSAGTLLYNDIATFSQIIESGWTPGKAENKHYKSLLQTVAGACRKTLGIESAFAKSGDEDKRQTALANAYQSLENTLDKLIIRTDFGYTGFSGAELSAGLDAITRQTVGYLRAAQGDTFSLAGKAVLAESLFVDGDSNNPEMAYTANDTFDSAQTVAVPSIVGGYVAQPGFGSDGRSWLTGDLWDVYSVTMVANQTITLSIGDGATAADLDLYLFDANGNTVAVSEGVTEYETLTAPAAGDYFVGVLAYSGASNYALSFGQQNANQAAVAEFVPGELIVHLKDTALPANAQTSALAQQKAAALGMQALRGAADRDMLWKLADDATARQQTLKTLGVSATAAQTGITQPTLNARAQLAQDTLHAVKALRKRQDIASADLNYIRKPTAVPSDPYYGRQWHYPLISLPSAWDVSTGNNTVVAVIDTGVLLNHPDLQGQLVTGYDFISDSNNANDGSGIDADPNDNGDSPGTGSHSYHGTHVSGTIAAATNNNKGIAGIAWNAKIMPLRVLGVEGGTDYDIDQAVRYAAGLSNDSGTVPPKKADVINLSLGGGGYSFASQQNFNEVRAAGVIVVAAAGNEATSTPSYPASYDGVISVSAVDTQKKLAPYSNYGNKVDVAAPGGDTSVDRNGDGFSDGVLSTLATGDTTNNNLTFKYEFYQGTSMATPHMAGVVALMRAVNPNLTPTQLDTLLSDGQITEDLGTAGRDNQFGHGLINARLAVDKAAGGNTEPATPKLGTAPSGLNFGVANTSLSLNLFNAGGGNLGVTQVTANQPWLSVQKTATDSEGLGNYTITANRTGLAEGVHDATLTITASTGSASVPVLLRVGGATTSDAGLNYYLLVNTATSATIELNPPVSASQGAYTLNFSNVPKGEYYLLGGTDMDNDFLICDGGELCGGYPSIEQLLPITVSENVADLQFTVNFSQALQIVANAASHVDSKLSTKLSTAKGIARARQRQETGIKRGGAK